MPERPTIRQILQSELRLGVAEGYVYGDWLDRKIVEYQPTLQKVNIGNDSEKMHKMIIGGRFDYMFAGRRRSAAHRRRRPGTQRQPDNRRDRRCAQRETWRYLMCSKGIDAAMLKKRCDAAIKTIKVGREYERLTTPRQLIDRSAFAVDALRSADAHH